MSRFHCLMTRSSRLILAFSSASRSASQKAYRDKAEARTKSKKKFVIVGTVLMVRQGSGRSSWTYLQNRCLVFYCDHHPFNYRNRSAFLEFKSSLCNRSSNKVEHRVFFFPKSANDVQQIWLKMHVPQLLRSQILIFLLFWQHP